MAKVVVIKFKGNGKPYYFTNGGLALKRGQSVVVETARGLEVGSVVLAEKEVEDGAIVSPLKPVVRVATAQDEEVVKRNEARRPDAIRLCKEKIAAHNLPMKLIDCEFAFDGSKVIFTFTAEGRVDFRELVKDLASTFHIRIELRQVGARDETRILGGIAPCGRECCCAGCMPEPQKVGIKMAKNQGLSLNPGKINGLCGRLMCCLAYEDEYYAGVSKKMPKIGSSAGTPEGKGTVIATDMLKMTARLKIEKEGAVFYRDYPVSELAFKRGGEPEKQDKGASEEKKS
ncbi:MAG: stage 0 sporulation family protein [Clostridia bacterium]|nr:stage 0 sporulation family protein [Clostridia bacterium]